MAHWNPQTYLKFDMERLRPALDLMAQIPLSHPKHIIDLGCGPGNVTALVQDRWPESQVCGIDSSPDMLAQAEKDYPGMVWQQAEIADWGAQEPSDLIFSNACLHWLGDHDQLFPRLLNNLKSGGILAVQMPNNFAAPTHQIIRDVLGPDHPLAPGFPVATTQHYYDWLAPFCSTLNIWQTRYLHVLDGNNPVADWTRGAALRPVLNGLENAQERAAFEQAYRQRIAQAYPPQPDGKTLFPFERLFMVCVAI